MSPLHRYIGSWGAGDLRHAIPEVNLPPCNQALDKGTTLAPPCAWTKENPVGGNWV